MALANINTPLRNGAQWTKEDNQAPPAPLGQGTAPTPPASMSAALRRAKIWCAWLLLHSPQDDAPIFPAESLDEIDNFYGQTIDALLHGTGLESYEIYSKWPDNVVIHEL